MSEQKGRKLGPGERPEIRRRYPHMLAEDVYVWRGYLGRGGGEFISVWYDVHVGTPMRLPAGAPEFLEAVAAGVSRKRIDVVARTLSGIWVIELKPVCGAAALGQVLIYRDLFVKEFAEGANVRPVVICMQVEVDVEASAELEGVKVVALEGLLY